MIVSAEFLEVAARAILAALAIGIVESAILAGALWLALRCIPGTSAATRHVLWWIVLATSATLPLAVIASSLGHIEHRTARTAIASPPSHANEEHRNFSAREARGAALVVIDTAGARDATAPAATVRSREGSRDAERSPLANSASSPAAELRTRVTGVFGVVAAGLARIPHLALAIVVLWLGVAAGGAIALCRGLVSLQNIKRAGVPLETNFVASLRQLAARTRRGRRAELRSTCDVDVPVAVGYRSPAILIPLDVIAAGETFDVDQIAMHEYAHLVRYDDWTNLAQHAIERLFWFNPVIAFAGRRIALEREIACDDWVVSQTGGAHRYARCLWNLARAARGSAAPSMAPGAFKSPKALATRIERLLDARRRHATRISKAAAAALGAIAFALIFAQAGRAPVIAIETRETARAAHSARIAAARPARHELAAPVAVVAAAPQVLATAEPVNVLATAAPAISVRRETVGLVPRRHETTAAPIALGSPVAFASPEAPTAVAVQLPTTEPIPSVPPVPNAPSAASVPSAPSAPPAPSARYHHGRFVADARQARSELQNCHACDVGGSDLSGADLHGLDLHGASFEGANLRGANLENANLRGARFDGSDLSGADLRGANASDAKFQGADLSSAQFRNADLTAADLTGASLEGADFTAATLRSSVFRGTDVSKAHFASSDLRSVVASCSGCDLSGLDLRGADLHGLTLEGADLSKADLRGANLRGTKFEGVSLERARLDGADLRGAMLIGCDTDGIDPATLKAAGLAEAGVPGADRLVDPHIDAEVRGELARARIQVARTFAEQRAESAAERAASAAALEDSKRALQSVKLDLPSLQSLGKLPDVSVLEHLHGRRLIVIRDGDSGTTQEIRIEPIVLPGVHVPARTIAPIVIPEHRDAAGNLVPERTIPGRTISERTIGGRTLGVRTIQVAGHGVDTSQCRRVDRSTSPGDVKVFLCP